MCMCIHPSESGPAGLGFHWYPLRGRLTPPRELRHTTPPGGRERREKRERREGKERRGEEGGKNGG